MNIIHMTLQGKGGVGKTFVSTLLIQWIQSKNIEVQGFDTDPVNKSFTAFKKIKVKPLNILSENNTIDTRNFDVLLESFLKQENDFVVDNGASSFLPLSQYFKENHCFQILKEAGKTVFIHIVIGGGADSKETISGFATLCENVPDDVQVIIWKNEYHGKILYENTEFEDLKIYKNNIKKVKGIITIPKFSTETFEVDIRDMQTKGLTFEEIKKNDDFSIMAKSRLNRVKDTIFDQLNNLSGLIL